MCVKTRDILDSDMFNSKAAHQLHVAPSDTPHTKNENRIKLSGKDVTQCS